MLFRSFARSPLIRRIGGVGRQPIPADAVSASADTHASSNGQIGEQGKKENGFPIIFMYGEHDWMDIAGGFAAEQKLKEVKEEALKNASVEDKKKESGHSEVVVIKRAGHHLYLDGFEEFNEKMRQEMVHTIEQVRRGKSEVENSQKL